MSLLYFVTFGSHQAVRQLVDSSAPSSVRALDFCQLAGVSALILLLLPDLSVSHNSIPQELRAVSTGAQETQIW